MNKLSNIEKNIAKAKQAIKQRKADLNREWFNRQPKERREILKALGITPYHYTTRTVIHRAGETITPTE